MMDQSIDIVLREREPVVMHVLFADRAVDQMFGLPLDEIKHDGSFTEAYVLIPSQRRSPAPAPAAIRAAYQARVTAVSHRNCRVAPLHYEVIVHKKIRSIGVANLIESFGSERLFDGRLHALPNHFVIGVRIALHRLILIAGNHIARNDGPRVARVPFPRLAWLRRRAPRPGGQLGYADVRISCDLDVVVTTCQQEPAKQSRNRQECGFAVSHLPMPHESVLRTDTITTLLEHRKWEGVARLRAAIRACSDGYSHPVLGRKNDGPKLGIGSIELEGYREIALGSVVYAHDPALLLNLILRIDQKHRLPNVQIRLYLHESAVGVDHLRHGLVLLAFAGRVFRHHRETHAQHDALTAPAIDRVGGTRHKNLSMLKSDSLFVVMAACLPWAGFQTRSSRPSDSEDVADFTLAGDLKCWPNGQALRKR